MNRSLALGTLIAAALAVGIWLYQSNTPDAPDDGGATPRTTPIATEAAPSAGDPPEDPRNGAASEPREYQPAPVAPTAGPRVAEPASAAPKPSSPPPAVAPEADPILAKMIETFSMDRLRDEGYWDLSRPRERERALALAARIPVESSDIAESFNSALSMYWRERVRSVGPAAARAERAQSPLQPIDPDTLPRR